MLTVLNEILKINVGFSNHIVALEEVTVVGLNSELVILIWDLDPVDQSVLEVWFAILVSIMGFSLLDFFVWVEEGSEEHITGAFYVHDLHVGGVEDADSYFKFFWWSSTDVPYLMIA